jgi:hypothetical protein
VRRERKPQRLGDSGQRAIVERGPKPPVVTMKCAPRPSDSEIALAIDRSESSTVVMRCTIAPRRLSSPASHAPCVSSMRPRKSSRPMVMISVWRGPVRSRTTFGAGREDGRRGRGESRRVHEVYVPCVKELRAGL